MTDLRELVERYAKYSLRVQNCEDDIDEKESEVEEERKNLERYKSELNSLDAKIKEYQALITNAEAGWQTAYKAPCPSEVHKEAMIFAKSVVPERNLDFARICKERMDLAIAGKELPEIKTIYKEPAPEAIYPAASDDEAFAKIQKALDRSSRNLNNNWNWNGEVNVGKTYYFSENDSEMKMNKFNALSESVKNFIRGIAQELPAGSSFDVCGDKDGYICHTSLTNPGIYIDSVEENIFSMPTTKENVSTPTTAPSLIDKLKSILGGKPSQDESDTSVDHKAALEYARKQISLHTPIANVVFIPLPEGADALKRRGNKVANSRIRNALIAGRIYNVKDLLLANDAYLLKLESIGPKWLKNINEFKESVQHLYGNRNDD